MPKDENAELGEVFDVPSLGCFFLAFAGLTYHANADVGVVTNIRSHNHSTPLLVCLRTNLPDIRNNADVYIRFMLR